MSDKWHTHEKIVIKEYNRIYDSTKEGCWNNELKKNERWKKSEKGKK